ncbi:uncharacterized protein involved in cysteine biosynthesis [Allocatelliglobosispora scoriae]|uniref:Uncharacterized protein involved in cysteine biosynthesis n=1 Tax=Allocatelliglobosispora scoriae TaxID=643052 RepID=A0A841BMP8_9ACTN|nr:uncharacterized protein involved in cysteine biosynthesis [Allocatelliglobosispora scoriae]
MLIPAINVAIAPALVLLLNGFLLGLVVLAIPLHHRGVRRFRDHLRYAWRNRSFVTGYGITSILILAVPFTPLRLVTIPVVMVGAVLLYHRIERAKPLGDLQIPAVQT